MTRDAYEGFAERYDLSFDPFGEYDGQTAESFRQLFVQNHIHTVLDCACGTGRHLPLFHSLGCEVFGSDISDFSPYDKGTSNSLITVART